MPEFFLWDVFVVLIVGSLVGIYIWRKPPQNRRKVVIGFGLFALMVVALGLWGLFTEKKFAKMSDSEHLSAAKEAYLDDLLDQAETHLAAIKNPDSMRDQIEEVRGKVAKARDQEREQKAKERELQKKEQDKPDIIDSLPLVEHRKKMMINSGRWFAGEYHICEISVSENPSTLMCPDLPNGGGITRMDVVFKGSMKNPKWDCKRRPDDIYCEPKTD